MSIINDPNKIRKILVMQLGPFGDILLTTAYFEHLKRRFPQARISYLIKEKYLAIVKEHPVIDEFIILTREKGSGYFLERIQTIFLIRSKRFDIVIDQQNKISTNIFTLFSAAKIRLGYRDSRIRFAYSQVVEQGSKEYTINGRFELIKPLGIERTPYRIHYKIKPESETYISHWLSENVSGKFLLISPGSPVRLKKWNIALYARVADRISQLYDLLTVWLWAPSEKQDALKGMELMKNKSVLAPETSLNEAAALLQRTELFLCNDGGINHLAAVVGARTIALFGVTDPVVWSPAAEFPTHHHLYNENNDAQQDDSFGISVEEVVALAKEVLHA
jgi:ADP-heptose:LPS heptosyltransferase